MARYLVIEFENNESASALMEKINKARRSGGRYRVVGLYVKPRRFCQCPDGPASMGGASFREPKSKNSFRGVLRGEKYGWWVCNGCNRPRMGGHQLVNQLKSGPLYPGFDEGDFEMVAGNLSIDPFPKKRLTRLKLKKKVRV